MSVLYKKEGGEFSKWNLGSTALLTDMDVNGRNLIISVLCSFGASSEKYLALFDTGAEWAVIPESIVQSNLDDFSSLDVTVRISTRLGPYDGVLHQCNLCILVDNGEDIIFEATVLVIPDWDGPVVLGFKSLLNKIRWACDPTIDQQGRLYFGVVE